MGGIDQLESALAAHVEAGELPGLVALVAQADRTNTVSVGTLAFDDPTPMTPGTVMRIASLTKPITAAATMILIEDGDLAVTEPVDRLLPELADRRVLRSPDSELDDTVPARRPITVEDLLTFRCGFGCVLTPPGSTPIQRAEEERQLMTLEPQWPPPPFGHDEWMRRFATLPLIAQPGERWLYNTGAQILGVLIERATGMPLDEFLRTRIFDPLGMGDTAFSWPAGSKGRIATAYAPNPDGPPRLFDRPDGYWSEPPALPNGAAWLVSTVEDYWKFVDMLLHDGISGGRTFLSRGSVAAMITDHLDAAQRRDADLFLGGSGWGYCMATPPAGGGAQQVRGYGWDGGSGTTWRSDPSTGLTGILFTQRQLSSPQPPPLFVDFWAAARTWAG